MKTHNSQLYIAQTLLLFMLLLAATPIIADTIAFTPTGGSASAGWTARLELGARFSVSSPLAVTGLGYYDFGSDGFLNPHAVTLWDDVGNMIASATVSSLSQVEGDTFAGGAFRFAPIVVTLETGIYRLSGRLESYDFIDPVLFDNSSPGDAPLTASGITYLGRVVGPDWSGAEAFPSVIIDNNATNWFGPNLLVTPVPEPSLLLLALLGVSTALCFRQRRAKA
jgi:hypothetical protein